ncbi:NBR1-Ig-like domain-containing protein [Amycolatopsis sp. NPDC048633]|uniref:NBR1-Ig-like domain-containing protein n=1 Tax=Amycolatopsis sp. NPDC048633 TaxID=3157095 RepID=UPI003401C384
MDVERTPGRRGRIALGPAEETGPVAGFARRLWELKRAAGDPSYDRMRDEFGALASKSALSAAARGRHLPSWETTWEFVRVLAVGVLGQDETSARLEWRGCWEKAREPEPEVRETGRRRWALVPGAGAERRRRAVLPEAESQGAGRRRWALVPGAGTEGRRRAHSPEPGSREAGPESSQPRSARESSLSREPEPPPPRRRWAAYGLATAVAVALVVAVVLLFGGAFSAEPAATGPGDVSEFVADVTVPDGAAVSAGSRFVKTWELRNAGSVGWIGRYIVRSGSFGSPDQCRTPDRVPVPYTAPGDHVRISVDVQAPPVAGHCQVYWKMADSEGHLLLPDARAVFFSVRIAA